MNPEALRDMAFWFHQDRLTVRYKGLSFDLDPDSLPVQSAVGLLVSSLEQALAQQGLDFAYDEGRILVTGEGGFQLALDPASGELLTLTVPEMDFSAQFSYP